MLSQECRREFQTSWLPNISGTGRVRLIELLEKSSPLLIHGSFTRVLPMGCLATHVGWNHPQTAHLTLDAGICWLNHVAGLLDKLGFRIVNVDSTVGIERPKLARHIPLMRKNIASALGIEPAQISVKAKSGEGVDAVGRGEAIRADAVCLLVARLNRLSH